MKKNFENRLTFGEVMGKSLVSCFMTHGVQSAFLVTSLMFDVLFFNSLWLGNWSRSYSSPF